MYFKKLNNGSGDQFVGEANVVAPFSTIQNRAKVEANCKVVGPVERIKVNSLKEIPNEFGPNGEKVYTSDKEDSRVRFIGDWSTTFDANGMKPVCTEDSSVEITFYGTGLNILEIGSGSAKSWLPSIDGGVEQANIFTNPDTALNSRNYNSNIQLPVISGLSLGWHTVKIRNGANFVNNFYGFEILNESSDLSILSGSIYKRGYEYILENDVTIPMIPTAYVGSNGGRVLTYLDEKSQVRQAINEVGTPAYLASTDHSNEAIYRKINFREFGRNRVDDFSTLSGTSDRAFTLDDGTTTLVGDNVLLDGTLEALSIPSLNSYFTLTFIGTGLDIINGRDLLTDNIYTIFVNGVSVGTLTGENKEGQVIRVVSGLPYDTHNVKIQCTTDNTVGQVFSDFIIYRPKKPSISKELPVLADYNIMADFVANTIANEDNIATGVLRKTATREFLYSGNWSVNSIITENIGGFEVITNTANSYIEYTFIGTGFEYRFRTASNRSNNITLTVDGQVDNSGFDTSFYGTNVSYDNVTGLVGMNNATPEEGGIRVSGLPFGKHTIRLTVNDNNFLVIDAIDIIVPIHAPNTSIGNLSLSDDREQSIGSDDIELSWDLTNAEVLLSKGVAQVIDDGTGISSIYFEESYIANNEKMVSGISGAEINLISLNISNTNIGSIRFLTRNDGGTAVDSSINWLRVSGKKQKDIFKD